MNKTIIQQLGKLIIFDGLAMLFPFFIALLDKENITYIYLISIPITVAFGIGMYLLGWQSKSSLRIRDGYILVTLAWLFATFFGTLPMVLSGCYNTVLDAFFETLSGFTATGITVLDDVESLPRSILLWRSMTQWLGGLGIVVLFVAILSSIGAGSMQLYRAETTGPVKEKLSPRISDTAKILWLVYILLTLADTICLLFCGMDPFDAVNHSMTTIATGGFSTKNGNLAAFPQQSIQWVTMIFMFLSGMSFATFYHFQRRKSLDVFFKNSEWRLYVYIIIIFTAFIWGDLFFSGEYDAFSAVRVSLFNVIAVASTAGFIITDFEQWHPLSQLLLLFLMYTGACAGSTSGGLKIERLLILLKQTKNELMYILHPRMITSLKINGNVISNRTIINTAIYVFMYTGIMLFSMMVAIMFGLPLMEAFTTSLACLGNGGLSLGLFGPTESFSQFPDLLKLYNCILMLAGRLELYTILVVLVPLGTKRKDPQILSKKRIRF